MFLHHRSMLRQQPRPCAARPEGEPGFSTATACHASCGTATALPC